MKPRIFTDPSEIDELSAQIGEGPTRPMIQITFHGKVAEIQPDVAGLVLAGAPTVSLAPFIAEQLDGEDIVRTVVAALRHSADCFERSLEGGVE